MEGSHVIPSVDKLEQIENGSCEQTMENSPHPHKKKIQRKTFLSKSPVSIGKTPYRSFKRLKNQTSATLADKNYFYQ